MSSQHRSSDETSIKTNSFPYIVLKTDTPARKWTPEENDRFLNMIDNRVIGDMWSVKSEEKEKVVNRSSGEKKTWTSIFKKSSKSSSCFCFCLRFGFGGIWRTLLELD